MHVMIDLETLGTDVVTAPIIQIAAAPFRLEDDGPAPRTPPYIAKVNVNSNLGAPYNRCISADTVAWWAETDPALLVKLMKGHGVSLSTALGGLNVWFGIEIDKVEGVWANGATFDITMLEMAYQQEGMRAPWPFRAIRDVRTMAMIAGDDDACWKGGTITEDEANGQKHDAYVDCLRQLRMVQQTWQRRINHAT